MQDNSQMTLKNCSSQKKLLRTPSELRFKQNLVQNIQPSQQQQYMQKLTNRTNSQSQKRIDQAYSQQQKEDNKLFYKKLQHKRQNSELQRLEKKSFQDHQKIQQNKNEVSLNKNQITLDQKYDQQTQFSFLQQILRENGIEQLKKQIQSYADQILPIADFEQYPFIDEKLFFQQKKNGETYKIKVLSFQENINKKYINQRNTTKKEKENQYPQQNTQQKNRLNKQLICNQFDYYNQFKKQQYKVLKFNLYDTKKNDQYLKQENENKQNQIQKDHDSQSKILGDITQNQNMMTFNTNNVNYENIKQYDQIPKDSLNQNESLQNQLKDKNKTQQKVCQIYLYNENKLIQNQNYQENMQDQFFSINPQNQQAIHNNDLIKNKEVLQQTQENNQTYQNDQQNLVQQQNFGEKQQKQQFNYFYNNSNQLPNIIEQQQEYDDQSRIQSNAKHNQTPLSNKNNMQSPNLLDNISDISHNSQIKINPENNFIINQFENNYMQKNCEYIPFNDQILNY
ncbi:hypothetical protein PPERSA_05737 [Pseudocohnilembus persalinus]|uniref:Uncharacterized protein n=1 Tax=Pseudocohnilembus persalinus TaxID=266149 RepID=A0A0V0QII1_PSEPJ|nr:hypothetical protein PPERSA_05737 [Pseudocohnilembus persalinus]|eukprot:KRX01898.1 hypothetical protein PPERSA_05737 [Pseudocohnilembus persalinus]